MKPPKISQRGCSNCKKRATKCQKDAMEWGLGDFIMILFTLGLWAIGRFIWHAVMHPWRCSECGAKV